MATHVLREQRACRISLVPGDPDDPTVPGSFYDLDARIRHNVRSQDMPPFKTLIAVPVYFGTQVLGIVELGWTRPCSPRVSDVRVLEVICDYLSIELVGVVSSLRARPHGRPSHGRSRAFARPCTPQGRIRLPHGAR
ncbi:MAG: GAF domain-containing protein [Collinsella sp.]